MKYISGILFCLTLSVPLEVFGQTPPYSGTIFIDPDIITSTDPSTILSTTYTGQGQRFVYDRRVSDWVTITAYLFDVVWNDGLTSEAIVNIEFDDVAAATIEAEKYAFLIGQMPSCLRTDVDEIWIHKGVELFGGGNRSILIHTGQSINYENDGILEETLMHEASHTSLDEYHATSTGWTEAQSFDGNFISTYARDNPTREDIAESFLVWYAVRHKPSEISDEDFNLITSTIPNRLAYFDDQSFELTHIPLSTNTNEDFIDISVYPNPVREDLNIESTKSLLDGKITITNLFGQPVYTGQLDDSHHSRIHFDWENGLYFVTISNKSITKKFSIIKE
jgi:hypothetical protein